jgi:hypothetical protein
MKRKYVLGGLAGVATIALVSSALGGPSLQSLVQKEVAKQLSAAQTAKSKSKRGPRGPAGPAGANGANGANGAPGATGAAGGPVGGGLLTGLITAMPSTGVTFGAVTGISTATASLANIETQSSSADTIARNLAVILPGGALTGSQQRTFALTAGGVDVISCTVKSVAMGGTGQSCTSTTTGVVFQQLFLHITQTPSGTPPVGNATFGLQITLP